MRLSTLFIGSVEFNEWHLKEEWVIFLFKNASIRREIWTIHMICMNPRLFFSIFMQVSWKEISALCHLWFPCQHSRSRIIGMYQTMKSKCFINGPASVFLSLELLFQFGNILEHLSISILRSFANLQNMVRNLSEIAFSQWILAAPLNGLLVSTVLMQRGAKVIRSDHF